MKDLRKNQKGIALLIALFALLLLSAVGLSMMFSSDSETSINANYRDKQQVSYAALSGALEAKDRIQPSNTSSASYIPFPTDAPTSSSGKQIWYIINPGVGESASNIQPWNPDNKYADTELCHDNVLGLSGTAGAACSGSSSLPTGSNWYNKYDNSASSYAGAYKLGNPLQYKWARIQLKTVDSGPYTVAGGTSGQIVCWDGHNQIPQPVGYKKDCTPNSGTVGSISVVDPGSGYSSAPNVTLSGGGGSNAAATAVIGPVSTGAVSSITVDNAGSNYTSQPTVTITGDGTGATAVATIFGGTVTAVNLTSAGTTCFQTAPTVSITGGGGTGATAQAVLASTSSCIYAISGGSCNSNTFKGNTLDTTINGGNGDAVATITYKNGTGGIQSAVIKSPGTGYTSLPTTLTYSGNSCTPSSTFTLGKRVASFTVTNGGSGYNTTPTVTVSTGVGTAATAPTATASISGGGGQAGKINTIAVTAGGTGYTTATVTISGGGGSGGAATANLGTTNQVTAINVTNGGSGYTSAPTVVLNGGGCGSACATATAFLANGAIYGQVFQITSLAVSNNGASTGSRAMVQMEVATPPRHRLGVTGALTLAGPSVDGEVAWNPPLYNSPNSNPFHISGVDANSCGQTAKPSLPAIGVYDDPQNPTTPTAQSEVSAAIPSGRTGNYVGSGATTPDVQDIYTDLGDTNSPANFESFANSVASVATNTYNPPAGTAATSVNLGSATTPTITVVNGDLTLSGNPSGTGILLVTGTLTMSGNFSWNGVILVI